MLFRSVADAIGNTPLVALPRIAKHYGVKGTLYAKLEHLNPGYSKKDRVARRMIQEAKADGRLQAKQPVIELTSGNTGIGLAIVCANFGHPFTAVMSKGNSVERARMMKALGASVVLVDQMEDSSPGFVSQADLEKVEAETNRLTHELGAFRADQFNLISNENAHYFETGPEIWISGLRPKAFVDFAGTGGTFSGVARFLKEQDPSIWCAWVEPENRAHQIQGGGYFTAPNGDTLLFDQRARDGGLVDEVIQVGDEEAVRVCRDLARLEGVFGGFSAGANACAAVKLLRERNEEDFSTVFLICDSGLKYLSLDLYEK